MLVFAGAVIFSLSGCHDVTPLESEQGAPCDKSGACASGLVCAAGQCRVQCLVDEQCSQGACLDFSQAKGCSLPPEIGCTTAACPKGMGCSADGICRPATENVCDFKDDDGNGQIDEGFAWVVSEWATVLTLDSGQFARPESVIVSGGDRVIVAVGDEYGGGRDRVGLLSLDREGQVIRGPTWTDVPSAGVTSAFLAEGVGVIALMFDSTDYAGCQNSGCPITHRLFRNDNDQPVTEAVQVDLDPHVPKNLRGLAYTEEGYAFSINQKVTEPPAAGPYIAWLDPKTGLSTGTYIATGLVETKRTWKMPTFGTGPNILSTPVGLSYMFWRDATPDSIEFGIIPPGGKGALGKDNEPVLDPFLLSAANPFFETTITARWGADESLVVQYNDLIAPDGSTNNARWQIAKVSTVTKNVTIGPNTVGMPGDVARDLVALDHGKGWLAAAITYNGGPVYWRILRLGSSLEVIPAVGGVESLEPGSAAKLVALEDRVLVIRGNGSLLQVATISCAPQ